MTKSLFGTFRGIPNKNIEIGAKAVQIYEDKSIFSAPLMSNEEWQAMSEEHQAAKLAAESQLAAKCEAAYQAASAICKERWANELMACNSGRVVK